MQALTCHEAGGGSADGDRFSSDVVAGSTDGAFRPGFVAVPGPNCGYGQVMAKLTDGLYCQRRGRYWLAGLRSRRRT